MRDGTTGAHPLDKDSYDWAEAFTYAGDISGDTYGHDSGDLRRAHPQDTTTSLEPFGRADVEEVVAYEEGENDEADWVCLGKLKDGRWFYLSAGCDYTGWDCQAGGSATVAQDKETLLAHGMTDSEKARLHLLNQPERDRAQNLFAGVLEKRVKRNNPTTS